MSEERQRKGSLLGVVAYVLVPGERRVRAASHFRKAGLETLMGFGELVRPGRQPNSTESSGRERIEID
jgi:hypothetical protein